MRHKRFSLIARIACLLWVCAAGCSRGRGPHDVVLIVVDTLRADALTPETTPHILELARDGVRFESAFSHAPLTLPAHTALFSASLPGRSRVTNNGQAVEASLPLLAQHLAQRGYQTLATTSLATLWPVAEGRGLDRGFAAYERGEHEVSPASEVTRRLSAAIDTADPGAPLFLFAHYSDPHQPYNAHGTRNARATISIDGVAVDTVEIADMLWWTRTLELEPGEHELAIDSDVAFFVRSLRAHSAGRPLDAGVGEPVARRAHRASLTHESAGPLELTLWLHDAPDLEEIRRRYRLEAEAADRAIGELIADLRAAGRYDESLIVFTSDHGEGLGEHGTVGHARHLYDELLHVPLIIKPPAGHPRTQDLRHAARQLARHIDVAPTLLELLDLPALDDSDGTSLLESKSRVLAAEAHPPEAPRSLYALRDEERKLVYDADRNTFELYRLQADPGELIDVHDPSEPDLEPWRDRLRARAEARVANPEPADAETRRRLKVLGY